MGAQEKGVKLDWLRDEPEKGHCKNLFNVRCLSEGVDLPNLDAVMFLPPESRKWMSCRPLGGPCARPRQETRLCHRSRPDPRGGRCV
jgi:hypothetical protein